MGDDPPSGVIGISKLGGPRLNLQPAHNLGISTIAIVWAGIGNHEEGRPQESMDFSKLGNLTLG